MKINRHNRAKSPAVVAVLGIEKARVNGGMGTAIGLGGGIDL